METEKYYVYKITNSVNDKVYVGMTKDTYHRMKSHKTCAKRLNTNRGKVSPLHSDMNKLGFDKFSMMVIEETNSKSEALDREAYWIQEYNSIVPNGYNRATYDSHGWEWTDEQRQLHSENMMNHESFSKKVICLETKEVYPSLEEAGRANGCTGGNIGWSCKKYIKACGKHFLFLSDWNSELEKEILNGWHKNKGRHVVCVETGQIFPDMKIAGEWAGLKNGKSDISACCRGKKKSAGGYHWVYEGDEINPELLKPNKKFRKVMCLETKQIFDSISKAKEWAGISNSSLITNCCKGRVKTAGGYHWQYVD